MNIIEKIKEFFRRNKTKALPEPNKERYEDNEFFNEIRVTEEQAPVEQVNNRYLEGALQQFFEQYEQFQNYGIESDFYSTLISINSLGGDCNANAPHESALLEFLNSSGRYNVQNQCFRGDSTTPEFYHIQTEGYQMPSFDKMVRLYINCRNENASELAYWLTYCNNNPQFYLKVNSNAAMMQGSRSEKIVIYTSEEQVEYCMQLINHVKTHRPDLFIDSEKTNPFMQAIDGVACAKQPTSDVFMNLDGTTQQISKSANRHISTVLKESYMAAAREIAAVDPQLQFLLQPENYNNESLYMQNYKYMNAYYHTFLVNSMETKMRYLCMQNGVTIRGINDNSRQTETEQGAYR